MKKGKLTGEIIYNGKEHSKFLCPLFIENNIPTKMLLIDTISKYIETITSQADMPYISHFKDK